MSIFGCKETLGEQSGTDRVSVPLAQALDGDLNMNGHAIRGLSTAYPPPPVRDQALSFFQTTGLIEDAAERLLVRKNGDTMSGDLNMDGHVIKGLPTTYPPIYAGDEACSWRQAVDLTQDSFQAVLSVRGGTMKGSIHMDRNLISGLAEPDDPQDAATKNYVDARKPLVTVWAEEKGSLSAGASEWSFGNGGEGLSHARIGYTMLASGRVLRMGIAAASSDRAAGTVTVGPTVNGVEKPAYRVQKESGSYSEAKVYDTPLELSQGDRLNFRTAQNTPDVKCAVVSALIELDL